MNKKLGLLSVALLSIVIIATGCSSKPENKWVAKFGGQKIKLGELNDFYYAQFKMMFNMKKEDVDQAAKNQYYVQQNPLLDKSTFLDEMIKQRMIYKKADKEGYLKKDIVKTLIKVQEESLVTRFYLNEKLTGQINITDQELDAEHKTLSKEMRQVPADQLDSMLRQKIMEKKFNAKVTEIVDSVKGSYNVESHPELITALTAQKSDVVLKIGDDKTTLEQFNEVYYNQIMMLMPGVTREGIDKMASNPAFVEQSPLLKKSEFFDQFLKQKIIYLQAKKEDTLKNKELASLLKLQTETYVVNYFIRDKIDKDINISEQEIAAVYESQKSAPQLNGMSVDQAEQMIRSSIYQQQFQQKYTRLVTNIKDEVGSIKRQEDLLKM